MDIIALQLSAKSETISTTTASNARTFALTSRLPPKNGAPPTPSLNSDQRSTSNSVDKMPRQNGQKHKLYSPSRHIGTLESSLPSFSILPGKAASRFNHRVESLFVLHQCFGDVLHNIDLLLHLRPHFFGVIELVLGVIELVFRPSP